MSMILRLIAISAVFSAGCGAEDLPATLVEARAVRARFESQSQAALAEADQIDANAPSAEREGVVRRVRLKRQAIFQAAASEILPLVEPAVAEEAAVEDLIWIAHRDWDSACGIRAVELLKDHHLLRPKTLEFARRMDSVCMPQFEALLKAQFEAAELPDDEKPRVLRSLAATIQQRGELIAAIQRKSEAELARIEEFRGKTLVETLRNGDVIEAEREAIRLYSLLADEFGNMPRRTGQPGTYGDLARAAIFEIENLGVGKVAPELEGEDLDGVKFRLSDYRGKVVLLSFWASWCGPCMELVPHERELVERLQDQPFVLIGVNGDKDREAARTVVEKERINWRSFWSGPEGSDGPLPTSWNVLGWPTTYVIDRAGVIQAKNVYDSGLDEAIERQIKARP